MSAARLFSLILLLAFCTSLPVDGNPELKALMELKSSLDPDNKILTSWISNADPCSGYFLGVACNEQQKVANISLQGKGLSGWISPAVAELKCLSGLYLHYNKLSGEIPKEISTLTELTDLYLDVNNLTGILPAEIGNMASLQALQLCCNKLTGDIPTEIGSLKRLVVLALQNNRLTGQIPSNLGNLGTLTRLDLSFNNLIGSIPSRLTENLQLKFFNIQNNSLSGMVPPSLKRLGEDFRSSNNPGLCGVGFPSLRACSVFDNSDVNQLDPFKSSINVNPPVDIPESANFQSHCNQTHCTKSRKFPHTIIVAGVTTFSVALTAMVLLTVFRYRRRKQKICTTSDYSEDRVSIDQAKELNRKSPSPLVSFGYSNRWGTLADGTNGAGSFNECLNQLRCNMDEVESATQYFSEANLLGKSSFSAVYKGNLRDGSLVAIRSVHISCCKSEEAEFIKGLNLLTSLRHDNLVHLRGFCCSGSRGECFLIYDFAPKGNLSQYVDIEDGRKQWLDWSQRFSIINGIAKGIRYLHSNEEGRPSIVHRNISIEKVLLDHQFNPLIMDSGLPKLLADDVVLSTLKVSAAMGYLAPEYITTGRFTEKSDTYAFGVIVLQVLSGKANIGGSIRTAAEYSRFDDFVDTNLNGKYSKSELVILAKIAIQCTHEIPDNRPEMKEVVMELSNFSGN